MDTFVTITKSEKQEVYEEIVPQIRSLLEGEEDLVANLANVSSVLKLAFATRISWVGFYLLKGEELVLGPFQGRPACVRIRMGKGVCGTAASRKETILVPNVEEFPGHIVCDPDSKSEIVVPMLRDGNLLGVLDVDSPLLDSFDQVDAHYLEKIVSLIVKKPGSQVFQKTVS